jgi:N-acetylmuramic acid 6-phosphate etherase
MVNERTEMAPAAGSPAAVKRPELDLLPTDEVVALLLNAEQLVVPAVRRELPQVSAAAELVAARFGAGGRLVFLGAGTSGRIAVGEAAELPGTFGLDRARIVALAAGGAASTDRDEDDIDLAATDLAELAPDPADVVIAVAASGSTPYTLEIAEAARTAGAAVISVTTTVPSPLAALADVAVEVRLGSEVLRGSSRLTAGTAQKIVLNAITTAAMARLGRVHGDLMIDVEPANVKLRARAAAIVADIAGCSAQRAWDALDACGMDARAAVVHVVTGFDPAAAATVVARHRQLRDALAEVSEE